MNDLTILVVDDDPNIRKVVRFALAREGWTVHEADDGTSGLEQVEHVKPHLVVLDISMPRMDGTAVCRELRARGNDVPIIFLSSRNDEIDRVLGLELGADDFVTKPFSPRELVARVRAYFRRFGIEAQRNSTDGEAESVLVHGAIRVDLSAFQVSWNDEEIKLTPTEFDIVRRMVRHPQKVFSRADLMNDTIVGDRTIDSHIRRIRLKFEEVGGHVIETVHGIGYKLGAAT